MTSASQALPAFAVLRARGRHPPAPYLAIAAWSVFLVLADVANLAVAVTSGYNLWTSYFTMPVEVGLTLWFLSSYQPTQRLQRAYVNAIVVVGLGTAIILLVTTPSVSFEVWLAPILALIGLCASVHTLVHRSLLSQQPLTSQDWFGLCLGLSLFWGISVPLPPFANALLHHNIQWVDIAYQARDWVMIVSFILMAWGILCSRRQTAYSGPS